ncbi:MAG: hypothetical protein L3J36_05045 [Rhodobacteraceae bacterium]|nr:hypothetical protein [Paracoccaceae bacterium]
MEAYVSIWAVIVIMQTLETEFGSGRAASSLPFTPIMIGFAVGNLLIGRLVGHFGVTLTLIGAATWISLGYGLAVLAHALRCCVRASFPWAGNGGGVRAAYRRHIALVPETARHCCGIGGQW